MKILEINTEATMASPGRIACELGRVFEEKGHEVVIAYGRGESPKDLKSIKIGTDLDVKIHGIKTRIFDNVGFNSKKATIDFLEKVKEYDPDVIHLHNLHGYYINIEILFNYLKEANKKVIWTLHDCWAFTGHCAYFDYIGCEKWKKRCYNCPQKNSYPSSKIFDNSESNYQKKKKLFTGIKDLTIVTPSKWLAGLVKESFLGEYRIKVINNGIDTEIFKPTASNFRKEYNIGNKKVILGVANIWTERKGYKYFEKLAKELDSNKNQIVLVGKMNKNQIKSMPKEIIWIKQTNNAKELAKIYTAADIFFNPTLEDNYPTVNLESLACGTPIITFNSGGSPEVITDTYLGKVIGKKSCIDKIKEEINKSLEMLIEVQEKNNIRSYSENLCKHSKFKEYLGII